MSQSDKAAYYRELKDAGVDFDRHYRDYTTEELEAAVHRLRESQPHPPQTQPQGDPEAAAAFNVAPHVIMDAVEHHHWLFLEKIDQDAGDTPENLTIEHEGE